MKNNKIAFDTELEARAGIKRGNNYTNREGEKWLTKEGYYITIIKYENYLDCDVEYEDGVLLFNRKYKSIKNGTIRKPYNRVGEKYTNTDGCEFVITEYHDADNITIQFSDNTILKNIRYRTAIMGGVKNYNFPTNHGVGYIGYGKYNSKNNYEAFKIWRGVIQRGYSKNHQEKFPNYKGVSVCEDWLNFQNFAKWFYENFNTDHTQKWDLDKDILVKGNKIYSPETCCFVPHEINACFVKNLTAKGIYKNKYGFTAAISKYGKKYNLGSYDTPEEAFQTYKKAKEVYIKELAAKWKNQIEERVYQSLINYTVDITEF